MSETFEANGRLHDGRVEVVINFGGGTLTLDTDVEFISTDEGADEICTIFENAERMVIKVLDALIEKASA